MSSNYYCISAAWLMVKGKASSVSKVLLRFDLQVDLL